MISIDFREETFNSPVHTHDFLEMLYIYSGTAVHHYKNEKSPVKKGDYVFIDFNSEHSVENKSDNFKAITCTFVPEFIDSSLFGCTSIADVLKNYNINLFSGSLADFSLFNDNSEKILQILMEMFDEYQNKEPGYLSIIRSCLIQILVMTMRKTVLVNTHPDKYITEVVNYVNKNYSEDVTLEALSKKMNFSLSYLSIVFKRQMAMTFSEYLRKVRIEAGCRLLIDSNKSIWEIAGDVGYNDVRSFRTHFKNRYNVTPLKFRKIFVRY
jgi:AraC family L-rhamnose operon transcriptional activator RhaR